jgi:hypothetical protein
MGQGKNFTTELNPAGIFHAKTGLLANAHLALKAVPGAA